MLNPWFKFYGTEYLGDQKMLALSACERSCWLTLLCYASQNEGTVKHLSESTLMTQAGIDFEQDEWERTVGVLNKLVELEMIRVDNGVITVTNWKKRQESSLTPYERVKKFREKKRDDNEHDNAKITIEKRRIEKNREEREKKPHESISFLKELPTQDLQELSQKYKISPRGIQSKATDLKLYCESKAKTYKNYRAFLENAIRKDQLRLRTEYPLPKQTAAPPEEKTRLLTPEEKQKFAETKQAIISKFRAPIA